MALVSGGTERERAVPAWLPSRATPSHGLMRGSENLTLDPGLGLPAEAGSALPPWEWVLMGQSPPTPVGSLVHDISLAGSPGLS